MICIVHGLVLNNAMEIFLLKFAGILLLGEFE